MNRLSGTLWRHVAVANSRNAELQKPPVVPIEYVLRALLPCHPDQGETPHVGEKYVLQEVKHQNKKRGIFVRQGADEEPRVDGT